jgi:hypothetical protein
MAQPRGIRRIIELAIDAASARRMKADAQRALAEATDPKNAQRNLAQLERGMEGLRGTALKIGAAVGAAFGALKLGDFLGDSVRAFREADAIWNRLAGTLETVGIRYSNVKKEIQAAAQDLERHSTFDDEAFAQSLTTLVSISGDYAKSLRNVQVAADLAAAKQIDIETASQLVGKAMAGQTGTLKRYGIVVKETDDAVEVMRQRFAGMAENELKTSAGRIQQLSNFWSDFKEAVGEGVATAPAVTGFLDDMSKGAQDASNRFGDLTTQVGSFIDTLLDLGRVWHRLDLRKFLLSDAQGALDDAFNGVREQHAQERKAIADIQSQDSAHLVEYVQGLRAEEAELQRAIQLRQRYGQSGRSRDSGPTPLAGAENPDERLQQVQRYLAAAQDQLRANQRTRSGGAGDRGGGGGGSRTRSGSGGRNLARADDVFIGDNLTGGVNMDRLLGPVGPAAQLRAQSAFDLQSQRAQEAAEEVAGMERVKDAWISNHAEMLDSAQGVAQGMQDAFARTFEMLIEDGENVSDVVGNLFKGMAASLAYELAHMAGLNAAKDVAHAFDEFALAAANPLTSAQHTHAALRFLAGAAKCGAGWAWLAAGVGGAISARWCARRRRSELAGSTPARRTTRRP